MLRNIIFYMEPLHDAGQMIWRYMDLPKFISLLTGMIWFARADTFEDKWEGFSRHIPALRTDEGKIVKAFGDIIAKHQKWRTGIRKAIYISCWSMAEAESVPMWKIYGSYDLGIAVQSTTTKFEQSVDLADFPFQALGPVQYGDQLAPEFDYRKNANFSWPLACTLHLRKRECFSFENEWRAVLVARSCDKKKKGIRIRISPADLIERVFVSPLASASFLGTVASSCERFGLTVRPERSQLGRRKPSRSVKP